MESEMFLQQSLVYKVSPGLRQGAFHSTPFPTVRKQTHQLTGTELVGIHILSQFLLNYGLPEPTTKLKFTEALKAWNILQT